MSDFLQVTADGSVLNLRKSSIDAVNFEKGMTIVRTGSFQYVFPGDMTKQFLKEIEGVR